MVLCSEHLSEVFAMRIIAEMDSSSRWMAWWNDSPDQFATSGSVLGAIARLLIHSPNRHVAASDLQPDSLACEKGHIEMVVTEGQLRRGR